MARFLTSVTPLILVLLIGCASADVERWRLFNDDGVALFSKGEYNKALESFDYALTFNSDDPVLLYNAAQCHDRLGDARRAEQYYVSCLQRDAKHGDARLALVSLKYRTGRTSDANQMIRDWRTQDPKSADALVAEAWLLRMEKNLPLAQGRIHEALAIDMHNRRALTELAILEELKGMPDRALVQYERILEREPQQIEIRERLELLKVKGVKRPLPN